VLFEMSESVMVVAGGPGREAMRTVRLRIPARPEFVTLARLALTGLAGPAEMSEEVLADLKLALTEAVSSSVRRAKEGREGHIELAFELDASTLVVEVADDGVGSYPGFPSRLADEQPAEGGLEIAIIRSLVDELEIESEPDVGGSRLRIVKRLRPT
jgi:serine/threonine-protein kinase RsbW